MFLGIAENLIYCMNDEFYEKIKLEMNQKKMCYKSYKLLSRLDKYF